jgi:hypothetical protein
MELGGFQSADGKGLTLSSLADLIGKYKKGGLSHYDYCSDGWRGRKFKVT